MSATRNCAQRMRPQAIEPNPLSGTIICQSVCLSVRQQAFCNFLYFVLISECGSSVAMHLSPHWDPEDPSGVHSSLYVYVSGCLSLCLSVSLPVCPHCFLVIIRVVRNCVQRIWLQATLSNPLSGSIILLNLHSYPRSAWNRTPRVCI